jgi:hypothetical protein
MKKLLFITLVLLTACNSQKQKGLVYYNDYESIKGWVPATLSKKIAHSGIYSNQLDSTHIYGAGFRQVFKEISENKVVKVKVDFWTYITPNTQGKLVVEIRKADNTMNFWTAKTLSDIAPKIGIWQEAHVDFTFPDSVINSTSTVSIYPWNTSKSTFYMDDLRLEFVLGY